MTERLLRLPTEADYLKAVRDLDAQYAAVGTDVGVRRYYERFPVGVKRQLGYVADHINPRDRHMAETTHDNDDVRLAVRLGSTAGLLIARLAYAPEPISFEAAVLTGIEFEKSGDEAHDMYLGAETIMEIGSKGLALAGEHVNDWLIDLEMQTVRDVRVQHFYRIGAGAVLCNVYEYVAEQIAARNERDHEAFRKSVDETTDFKWDEGLKDLLK